MQRVEVDRVKRYRGVYSRHWEAGSGIGVWIVPGPLRVLWKSIPLAIVATCFSYGWLDVFATVLLGLHFVVKFTDVFHDHWLPNFAPEVIGESYVCGSWPIEFEAVAGPRKRITSPFVGPGPWDREALIVKVLSGLPAELCVDNNDGDAALLNEPDN